jgi:hypothetical protein
MCGRDHHQTTKPLRGANELADDRCRMAMDDGIFNDEDRLWRAP